MQVCTSQLERWFAADGRRLRTSRSCHAESFHELSRTARSESRVIIGIHSADAPAEDTIRKPASPLRLLMLLTLPSSVRCGIAAFCKRT
jgi:hypothetical protein